MFDLICVFLSQSKNNLILYCSVLNRFLLNSITHTANCQQGFCGVGICITSKNVFKPCKKKKLLIPLHFFCHENKA